MYRSGFSLSAPFPNPFNPSTTINFQVPADTYITLAVYNVSGQLVAVLRDTIVSAGYHSVVWDALAMPSGIYFVTLKTGGFAETRKVLLMK